MDNLSAKFII